MTALQAPAEAWPSGGWWAVTIEYSAENISNLNHVQAPAHSISFTCTFDARIVACLTLTEILIQDNLAVCIYLCH